MLKRPRFRRHFHVVPLDASLVVLLFEGGHVLLEDRLTALLAPWLDGRHDVKAIMHGVEGQANVVDVHYGLSVLEERGFLEEAEETASRHDLFSSALGLPRTTVDSRLRATPLAVTTLGGIDPAPFQATLESLGVRVDDEADSRVVLVDDYLDPALREVNRRAILRNARWLLVKPVGAVLWIGPAFDPSRTPCWACLAMRLERNRPAHALAASMRRCAPASFPTMLSGLPPATTQAGMALAAVQTFKWIVQDARFLPRTRLATLDLRTLRLDSHIVTRQPFCPACGKTAAGVSRDPDPLILETRGRGSARAGLRRTDSPRTVFRRLRHHISPITGIVDRLARRYRHVSPYVHVYYASHVFTVPSRTDPAAFRELRARSCGTGFTAWEARAGALCEALERYSGVFQGTETRIAATYDGLGSDAIHPNDCLRFSPRQFATRDERNRHALRYNWIPEPFREDAPIEWAPVRSLTTGRMRYVPMACGYYGYPPTKGHDFCRADSNGSAAGGCVDEAILQGFFELVERDSVALWWYNCARRPAVALESFGREVFTAIGDHHRRLGRDLHVLDLTSDLDVPAVAAVSFSPGLGGRDLVVGFAAHLDPALAVARALKEMSQMLAWLLSKENRRVFTDTRLDLSFLTPDPPTAPRRREEFSSDRCANPRDGVMACVRRADACGLETLLLDQTRPDVGLSVVKVIVPGLRSWWPRFAPGRLYDVPERLGWIGSKRMENELNPVDIFF